MTTFGRRALYALAGIAMVGYLLAFTTLAPAQIAINPSPPSFPVCLEKSDAYKLALADMEGTLAKLWNEFLAEGRCSYMPATYLFTIETYMADDSSRVVEMLAFGERVWGIRDALPEGVWMIRYEPVEWDGVKGPHSSWYEAQEINPEARVRLGIGWKSCCNHADVVKTRFRVDRSTFDDEWWYLDGNTWRKVPGDIVHWSDPTPDGQPVLFVYQGNPTCFYPGDTGG